MMATPTWLSCGDPSSFSNPDDCKINHISLRLTVDFKEHVIKGCAVLSLKKTNPDSNVLHLDNRDLAISRVSCEGKDLKFSVGENAHTFGCRVIVLLPATNSLVLKIVIEYATSPKSTALQWLEPRQTAGKSHPYLFSQCQAIHARSLLPCQDTPAVKATYTAEVTVPCEMEALMSAIKKSVTTSSDGQHKVFSFEQNVPVPSYLIAIVVGALVSRDIGPRSKVWSEVEMIDSAAYEFAEVELMLSTAESLLGPYAWGMYDLLVLPPSFPYGGMENPCLTFVTPTIIAGDRSLVDVVAHEIAHSWTGNLITNKNPEHFWLNEGHTVFVERKICGRLHGEKTRHFEVLSGWIELKAQVDLLGHDHPFTCLVPKLAGIDPDDAFSAVPYEKGSILLMCLEQKLGGPEVFEPFLKAYIERFKFQSITTSDWKEFLYEFFVTKKNVLDEMDWDAWFFKPGMPISKPMLDTTLAESCQNLSNKWCGSSDASSSDFSVHDLDSFSSNQVIEFLAILLDKPPLSAEKIEMMRAKYLLDEKCNSEISFRWIRLQIRARVKSCIPTALKFVTNQGRNKFVRPIYRDLFGWEEAKVQCVENYKSTVSEMHPLTAANISKILNLNTTTL